MKENNLINVTGNIYQKAQINEIVEVFTNESDLIESSYIIVKDYKRIKDNKYIIRGYNVTNLIID